MEIGWYTERKFGISRTNHIRQALLDVDKQIRDHVEKMGHSIDEVENYRPLDEKTAKESALHFLVTDAHSFAPHFLNKTWILMDK